MEPFSLVVPTSFFHYCVMEFFSIHSFPGVAAATFVFRQCYFVWVQWLWRSFALEVTNSFGYFLFYPRANAAAAAAAKRVMERNLNYIFHVCKSDKRPAAEACFFSSCFPLPCVLGCHCCIYTSYCAPIAIVVAGNVHGRIPFRLIVMNGDNVVGVASSPSYMNILPWLFSHYCICCTIKCWKDVTF